MVLSHLAIPVLPAPPSWYPGHMMKFSRMLPKLLTRTDVVLELRDSRLPLTSINGTLEGALKRWRLERGWDPNDPTRRIISAGACEHVIVLNKRDLVPEWGMEPFRKAMQTKFPGQRVMFASWQKSKDIMDLNKTLVNIAKDHPHSTELNILVIGMPNVGKSTLLNALRSRGIQGHTAKAFQTSAQPGLTQALSTRLKLSLDPLVYAFDSPGVMLPFLGYGQEGAERGVKLALIAGIKEGLYDLESLAAYLLYRLNVLDPVSPAYLEILPAGAEPTADLQEFLSLLAHRMGMIKRGAEPDIERAARWFIKWWREEGGLAAAKPPAPLLASELSKDSAVTEGWGFDFQWQVTREDLKTGVSRQEIIQQKMEDCIDSHLAQLENEEEGENNLSITQKRKQAMLEIKEKRKQKHIAKGKAAAKRPDRKRK